MSLADYVLGLADDALIFSHRLAELITGAPQIEEDVAVANISLDLLGQARYLLDHAGRSEGRGRDEDDLAYLRDERDFRNCQLVELADPDFAHTVARLLLFSCYAHGLYTALADSTDTRLAGIAGKAVKEVAYHRDHARQWTVRLGDGTDESHRRIQAALESTWPYTDELFTADWVPPDLLESGAAADPGALREPWQAYVREVLAEATLTQPQGTRTFTGGRHGRHTEAFGYMLAQMQYLHRCHPGATW